MWNCFAITSLTKPEKILSFFKAFRSTSLEHYGLDLAHFYTFPGLAWQACLKKTDIELELVTDPDMLLMFERGIREGITQAVHQYAETNNKSVGDKFHPKEDSSFRLIWTRTVSMVGL